MTISWMVAEKARLNPGLTADELRAEVLKVYGPREVAEQEVLDAIDGAVLAGKLEVNAKGTLDVPAEIAAALALDAEDTK